MGLARQQKVPEERCQIQFNPASNPTQGIMELNRSKPTTISILVRLETSHYVTLAQKYILQRLPQGPKAGHVLGFESLEDEGEGWWAFRWVSACSAGCLPRPAWVCSHLGRMPCELVMLLSVDVGKVSKPGRLQN